MIELEKIKSSPFFQEVSLKKGERLFLEGDSDTSLYIVYDGEVSIEKITSKDGNTKSLALLGVGNIIGEGAINGETPKEVSVIAARNSILLKIGAQKELDSLIETDPNLGVAILKSIIHISNIRLLRSNKQIAANYEIHKAINQLESLDTKSVLGIIDTLGKILPCEGLLYIEKNPLIENYLEYKYDSRSPGKLLDTVFEYNMDTIDNSFFRNKLGDKIGKYMCSNELTIGGENYGYLIITRNSIDFHEYEEKMLNGMCSTFVGVIRQKKILEEENNKKYMRGI